MELNRTPNGNAEMENIIYGLDGKEDMISLRALWKDAFGDSDAYIEYYFSNVAAENKIFTAKYNGQIISMIHLNPYPLVYNDGKTVNVIQGGYIVGVATRSEWRRRGIMLRLMKEVLSYAENHGYALVYLMPEKEDYYKNLGFRRMEKSVYINLSAYVSEYQKGDTEYKKWNVNLSNHQMLQFQSLEKVTEQEWEKFNQRLSSVYHLFAVRTKEYMLALQKECRTLCGDVYIIRDAEGILATYGIMFENDKAEVVQYISAVPELAPLLWGISESGMEIPVYAEIFGDWTEEKIRNEARQSGHGIMFQVMDETILHNFYQNRDFLIHEIV